MIFEAENHTYRLPDSPIEFISVTQYISKFKKPFEKYPIASAVAKKQGTTQEKILKKWDMLGDISKNYGNVVHEAVEYWLKYGEEIKTPFAQQVVEHWIEFDDEPHHSEVVVYDEILGICGTIDLIKPVGKKKVILRDIKTNPHKLEEKGRGYFLPPIDDLRDSKLNEYRLQLSIYKYIVEKKGIEVVGLEILPYDRGFSKIEVEPLDVNKLLHHE